MPIIAADQIARIPLAPLLALQALSVRRQAQLLPEPPGARSGTAGAGPSLRLLIVGDSSAAGVGAETQAQALGGQMSLRLAERFSLNWRLEARTGATTASALAELVLVPEGQFDVAVTALGVNDVTRMVPVRRWVGRQKALHDMLRTRFGVRLIICSGVPPMGLFPLLPQPLRWVLGAQAARLDRGLARLAADRPDIGHVPFDLPFDPALAAEDGFHPSPLAYGKWAEQLADEVALAAERP